MAWAGALRAVGRRTTARSPSLCISSTRVASRSDACASWCTICSRADASACVLCSRADASACVLRSRADASACVLCSRADAGACVLCSACECAAAKLCSRATTSDSLARAESSSSPTVVCAAACKLAITDAAPSIAASNLAFNRVRAASNRLRARLPALPCCCLPVASARVSSTESTRLFARAPATPPASTL